MKVMFTGNPVDEKDGSGGVTFYGISFRLNSPVDISHLPEIQQGRLSRNSHFKVVEEAPKQAAAPAPVSAPRAAAPAPVAVEEPAAVAAPAAAPPPSPAPVEAPAAKAPPRIVRAKPTPQA